MHKLIDLGCGIIGGVLSRLTLGKHLLNRNSDDIGDLAELVGDRQRFAVWRGRYPRLPIRSLEPWHGGSGLAARYRDHTARHVFRFQTVRHELAAFFFDFAASDIASASFAFTSASSAKNFAS